MKQLLVMLVLCAAQPLWADRGERLEAVLEAWIADVSPRHAVFILRKEGMPDVTLSRGWDVAQPVVLASLSKAITAVCVAQVMGEGKLNAKSTSAEVLGYGAPGISVAKLLTHGSGLGPDQTQSFMQLWLDGAGSRAALAAERALNRATQTAKLDDFFYNNENYAVLGQIIAMVTGQSYEQACLERVIAPAGITGARVSDRVGTTLPWGDWEMSISDYAHFMEWAFGSGGVVGAAYQWPALPLNKWVSYGMGMFQRSSGPGYDFWHFGSYCFPFRLNAGAYGAQLGDGWTVVAAYDACLTDDQTQALQRGVLETAYP